MIDTEERPTDAQQDKPKRKFQYLKKPRTWMYAVQIATLVVLMFYTNAAYRQADASNRTAIASEKQIVELQRGDEPRLELQIVAGGGNLRLNSDGKGQFGITKVEWRNRGRLQALNAFAQGFVFIAEHDTQVLSSLDAKCTADQIASNVGETVESPGSLIYENPIVPVEDLDVKLIPQGRPLTIWVGVCVLYRSPGEKERTHISEHFWKFRGTETSRTFTVPVNPPQPGNRWDLNAMGREK